MTGYICYTLGGNKREKDLRERDVRQELEQLQGQEEDDRKINQLRQTQRNIAGQVKNAMTGGLSSNLEWGSRLLVECSIHSTGSSVTLADDQISGSDRFLMHVVFSPDYSKNNVGIRLLAKNPLFVEVKGPNDRELIAFTAKILDFIRDWSPMTTPIAS